MGGLGSGPKKATERSKNLFASYAQYAARTIYNLANDATAPLNVRLDAAKYICNRVWGMPSQSHDIGIQAEQMESATELLKKLSVNRGNGKGDEDALQGLGEAEGVQQGANEEV